MHYEAWVTIGNGNINILIDDRGLVHHFNVHNVHNVNNCMVSYEITRPGGELLARPAVELQVLEEDDHLKRVVVRSLSHVFEILPVPGDINGRWVAYKFVRKT